MHESMLEVKGSLLKGAYTLKFEQIDRTTLDKHKTMYTSSSFTASRVVGELGRNSGVTVDVLEAMIVKLKVNSIFITINQEDIGKELSITQGQVSLAIKQITSHRIKLIEKIKNGVYMVHPAHIWRCSERKRAEYLDRLANGETPLEIYLNKEKET